MFETNALAFAYWRINIQRQYGWVNPAPGFRNQWVLSTQSYHVWATLSLTSHVYINIQPNRP